MSQQVWRSSLPIPWLCPRAALPPSAQSQQWPTGRTPLLWAVRHPVIRRLIVYVRAMTALQGRGQTTRDEPSVSRG